MFFFFKQKTAYEMRISDWSSDVCSSDLQRHVGFPVDGFDFAIRMGRGAVSAANWTRLFGEQLVPVCSAAYRAGLPQAEGRADLRQATLNHVDLASEDWQFWLDARSEEHTSERQSLMRTSYAVFCLKKNKTYTQLS